MANNPFTPTWLGGTTISSPSNTTPGATMTSPANPMQFGSTGTANDLQKMFGGTVKAENITGPGGSYSNDMNMLNYGGSGLNAGLMADTVNKYGSTPGSYGKYLIDRDIAWSQGKQGPADPWANGPVSTQTSFTPQTPQPQPQQQQQYQQQQQQPRQFGIGNTLQGQQGQQGQQGNFMSQFSSIMGLLQMLGLFGGGQQQQQQQRPPQFPTNTGNYPYYSRFA